MKRVVWFALVVLVFTALLVPILLDLVRDVLLVEFLRLLWRLDRLVDSLPQEPFWLAFLFVALMVAAISLLPRRQRPDQSLDRTRRSEGRVAELALLIRRAGRRPYFRRRLVQRLAHLGRDLFAHRHGVYLPELGRGPAPAGRSLLRATGDAHATHRHTQDDAQADPLDPTASLQQALAHLRAEPATLYGASDPAVERFVRFLEEQLEVDHVPVHRSRR